jgi:hypothetical protein
MSRAALFAGLVPLALALAGASGCGDSAGGRLPVSGTVTLKGKALDEGVIEFVPLDEPEPGKPYTKSGAVVLNGKYSVPRQQGLVPGKYKVLISSGIKQEATGDEAPAPTPGGKGPLIDHIPADYNLSTKQVVEVKKGEANEFHFPIP